MQVTTEVSQEVMNQLKELSHSTISNWEHEPAFIEETGKFMNRDTLTMRTVDGRITFMSSEEVEK